LGREPLTLIHGVPVYRANREWNWAVDKDREGIDFLHRAFGDMWSGVDPIENYSCATPNIESRLAKTNILISGGSVSNSIARDYFNHFPGLREYHIDYEMPDYTNIAIRDVSPRQISALIIARTDLDQKYLP